MTCHQPDPGGSACVARSMARRGRVPNACHGAVSGPGIGAARRFRLAALCTLVPVSCGLDARQPGVRAASPAPVVWACGESLKVGPALEPQDRNSVWSAQDARVRLHGARGEYVGFQVVVRAGDAQLEKVKLTLEPLKSSDGKQVDLSQMDLFQQHYLKVTVPSQYDTEVPVPEGGAGEYPVQMVPLRPPRDTFAVPARRNQPIWIDVWVPEDQAPGEYSSRLSISAGANSLRAIEVQLTVWGFTLPRKTHLKTYLPTGPENLRWAFGLKEDQDPELRRLEDRFFQMAHQHRLNFQPSAGEEAEEEWGARYRTYLDGTAFKERAGIGVGQSLAMIGAGEAAPAAEAARIKRAADWWKAQNFPGTLVCYVYDEPQEDEEFARAAELARAIRARAGDLPLYVATTKPKRISPGLIDTWGELPVAEVAPRQASGEKIWATNQGYAAGPYVDTPGYAGRSQAWMAWRMKLDAWHFWDCCYWADRQNLRDPSGKRFTYAAINAQPARFLTDTWKDPLTFDQKRNPRMKDWIRLNGDGVLFYTGTPAGFAEPLASFTMKSLRRGLQDYEYLRLLQQKGGTAQDLVDRLVPGPNDWCRDSNAWDEVRVELGQRIDRISKPK